MRLLLFIFLLTLIWSCDRKKGYTNIQGFVYDSTSKKMLKSKIVFLNRRRGIPTKIVIWKHLETDNNGYFNFSFDAERNTSYFMLAMPDDELYDVSSEIRIEKSENSLPKFSCLKNGTVAFQLINSDTLDTLKVFNCSMNYNYQFNASGYTAYGGDVFTKRESKAAHNLVRDTTIYLHPKVGSNVITYSTTKVIRKTFNDTVNISHSDTAFIKVDY